MNRGQFIEQTIAANVEFSPTAQWYCCRLENDLPKRRLGKTGEELSVIGFGGILVMDEEQSVADNRVAQAFNNGVNYFDVAPSYGNAEEKLGPALEPYRQKSFLACKTGQRIGKAAQEELHQSLKNMRTDHFDLYQLHYLTTDEDIDTAFGPGGVMDVILKAREQGEIRYLGFSAHSEEAALAAMDLFEFDTILFPINYVNWFSGNFGERVIARAVDKEMGILALKAMAHRQREEDDESVFQKSWYHPIDPENLELLDMALRFTCSQHVTAVIPPGEAVFFPLALQMAANLAPILPDEVEALKAQAQGVKPIFKSL